MIVYVRLFWSAVLCSIRRKEPGRTHIHQNLKIFSQQRWHRENQEFHITCFFILKTQQWNKARFAATFEHSIHGSFIILSLNGANKR